MPPQPSRDVRRARFSRAVDRALREAKARGLTIRDIEVRTGVKDSTFYRWRAGDWAADPRGSQVRAFFTGLGRELKEAYDALGWSDEPPSATAPPPTDPDVEIVLRALADPDVSESDKRTIRDMLQMLAERHRRGQRRKAG